MDRTLASEPQERGEDFLRLLIVAAVSAVVAVLAVILMKNVDGPWHGEESNVRTAIAGAVTGLVSVFVSRNLRKDG
jgi:hypothetical protein